MRKFFLMAALIGGFAAAGSLVPSQANAMTISTPSAVQQALGEGTAVEQVRYVCRRVRRCGYRGCYVTRQCYNRPSYGYYGGYRRHHHRYRYY
jgi:hypothetical protein